jgi:hypothetical protein
MSEQAARSPAVARSVTRKPAAPAEKGPPRRYTPPGALARDHERMAGFLARGSSPDAPPSQASAQWFQSAWLAAYSCGGSRGMGIAPHRVPV